MVVVVMVEWWMREVVAIKSYNLQHTLGNKSNTRLLKTTTLMQWNPLMYA